MSAQFTGRFGVDMLLSVHRTVWLSFDRVSLTTLGLLAAASAPMHASTAACCSLQDAPCAALQTTPSLDPSAVMGNGWLTVGIAGLLC
jgi:hypothetical protein